VYGTHHPVPCTWRAVTKTPQNIRRRNILREPSTEYYSIIFSPYIHLAKIFLDETACE
jgi:hypothetical protein